MTHDPGHFKFCPLCATGLVLRAEGQLDRLTCPSCGYVYYHNPVPAAGGVVLRDNRICLVRRAIAPRLGDWTLPAGFIEFGESAAACVEREIMEETALAVKAEGVLGAYPGFDDPRNCVILLIYRTRETKTCECVAGDDADAVEFFPVDQIPKNIAFRAHRLALRDLFGNAYIGS
jgi:ADP-ribose pyrophosphatase YjhB (NUDIX family)